MRLLHSDIRDRDRLVRSVLVATTCVIFGVLTACSASVSIGNSDQITKPDDIAVGECLQVSDQVDENGNVEATKVDCNADGLTFLAATTVAQGASCPTENYSHLTFAGSTDTLCLTPNFAAGKCYQVPGGANASLVDYREIACDAAPSTDTVVYEVTKRTEGGEPACDPNELAAGFDLPSAVGFCLTKVTQG
ncbi:hypothetical protein [Gordonia rhizosphera]|nr:hypothetical protein [Gordonia rhizosphera]